MSTRHRDVSTNSHVIAAMTQVETVIRYLTIRGVSVKGVILRDCKPVIHIDYHKICEQLLKTGKANYVTFGKSEHGGFKQGVFMKGGAGLLGLSHYIQITMTIKLIVTILDDEKSFMLRSRLNEIILL